ncbi:MAG: hypothetical protein JW846_10820 [Dehalococcoidia bacterium]|nr:hypothetical protein [Dehalococcoidia bacterium]
MHDRNNLYYFAAAATVVLFIIALIGLSSCESENTAETGNQNPAVLNAYQQGYLDGYSKGYAEGWTAGMESSQGSATSSTCTTDRGCGSSVAPEVTDEDTEE